MIVVDTSAVVAILRAEDDAARHADALERADGAVMSAATYVELAAVVDGRRDPVLSRRLDEFLAEARVEIVPLTARQSTLARQAYRDYGRGSGSRAKLNLGDCFSYALAADLRLPLLYKGEDFAETDIEPASS